MGISTKSVCVVDGIASIAALYWMDNFRSCKKHLRLLAKKIGLLIKNVFLRELESQLEEI